MAEQKKERWCDLTLSTIQHILDGVDKYKKGEKERGQADLLEAMRQLINLFTCVQMDPGCGPPGGDDPKKNKT